jgi:hypothetical protein
MIRHRFSWTLCASLLLGVTPAFAQQPQLPRPSPNAKAVQTVGLTDFTVEYSCPGVKGRKIWGQLVPYDQVWRTGANESTKITFSKDVTFADKTVPAGTYALFTIPGKASWTVIFSKSLTMPATDYKPDGDVVRFQVKPVAAPNRERLAFVFEDFNDNGGTLALEWEKLRLPIPFKIGTETQAQANIKSAVDGAWRVYANAARYNLDNKKNYDDALGWIDTSLKLKEDWYNTWIKAALLAAKGQYKDALPLATKAEALGSKSQQFFLEADVKKALSDWKKKI